ncbi:MAG: 3-hydroxyacyl-[acyl-carrier-protein] dehydratase FabZ [Rhizobiales bacterium 65-9]|nr:3-hydroxyacyl-ACP dehydratase FabZ [Hyphomicrobiales bacterium]OJY35376.1 MAG: 3-hydroxyacyl-[acyl-carrier-protein] dehydratase FabZ [Rhizobiales bacterium 65-9]
METLDDRRTAVEGETKTVEHADIQTILDILPHRYPFLLVDRIVDMRGAESGVGIKNVTVNEPQFTGHFPGRPIFPGVLIVEGMAQTAGCLVSLGAFGPGSRPKSVLFSTVDKCKFRKPVVPGDTLRYEMTRIANKRNIWWYRGEAKVDGKLVAEAELSAMVIME